MNIVNIFSKPKAHKHCRLREDEAYPMETLDIFKNKHYGRGIRLYDSGLYTEAIMEFEQVMQQGTQERTPEKRLASFFMGEAYTTLGLTHLRMNMYHRAQEELKYALALHPEYADLRFHLAVVYYRLGQFDDAEEELRTALCTNPKFARALIYLGLTLLRKGEEVGLAEIASGISMESAYDRDKYLSALSLYRSKEVAEAFILLEELADTDVDQVRTLLEDGAQLLQSKRYSEAVVIFEQAVSVCPDYPDVRHSLGQCYLNLGKTKEAIDQLTKALEINENYTAARVSLGMAYAKDGNNSLAIIEFERALRNDPMNLIANRELKALKG